MLTGDDRPTSMSDIDEPPFLQERVTPVQHPPSRAWPDRITDFFDTAQPPTMLLLTAALAGLGLLLYTQQGDQAEPTDPLFDQAAAPSTAAPTTTEPPPDPALLVPASVGPDIGLPARTTSAPPEPSVVRTTAATEPPTSEATTTSEPPPTTTTQPPTTTTTQPTTETTIPPTTVLEKCVVRIRRADLYAEPSDRSEELGRVRGGRYPALAFTDDNGGWVLIESSAATGWIEYRRLRSVEGDCR